MYAPSDIYCHTAVMVGFSDSNSSVVLTEGAPFSPICIEIKRGGFPLHPSGILELTIQTESIGIIEMIIIASSNSALSVDNCVYIYALWRAVTDLA